jgi:hypothetical protein
MFQRMYKYVIQVNIQKISDVDKTENELKTKIS